MHFSSNKITCKKMYMWTCRWRERVGLERCHSHYDIRKSWNVPVFFLGFNTINVMWDPAWTQKVLTWGWVGFFESKYNGVAKRACNLGMLIVWASLLGMYAISKTDNSWCHFTGLPLRNPEVSLVLRLTFWQVSGGVGIIWGWVINLTLASQLPSQLSIQVQKI